MQNRRRARLASAALAAGVLVWQAADTTAIAADRLPNLVPQPASDIRLVEERGRTLLRFTSTVANLGAGPLELVGGKKDLRNGGRQQVSQRIYTDTGGHRDRVAGSFTWHRAHQHIHFNGFANYVLRPVQGGTAERIAQKTTFCVMDFRKVRSLPGTPRKKRYRACETQLQGISVGWGDIYGWWLPGQSIDVTDQPDGEYELRIVADPSNRLVEISEDDNTSAVRITLAGGRVYVAGR